MKAITLLLGAMLFSSFMGNAQCNGAFSLCSKKYDEVAYLTTHNAFNSSQGNFNLPNQNLDISGQLNIGVRAFMLDVYNWFGNTVVYHGSAVLGTSPFEDELQKITDFLDNNPNEVVTVILECYVSADDVEAEMIQSGLMSYVYEHQLGTAWPTLQTMITNNKRCVVFSDVDDASASQGWYHYMWTNMVETHYSNNDISDFSCDFNRGDSINDLFILNHFVTNSVLGTGLEAESEIANSNPYFINRALQCQQEKAKFPNFVTVDFVELGDSKLVVDQLNGVEPLSIGESDFSDKILISPNPTEGFVTVISDKLQLENLQLISLTGQDVTNQVNARQIDSQTWKLNCDSLENGVYLIQSGLYSAKLVKD
ncbi:MAG: phosphatidylinositol-specific phospholipase C domain-containing protein [Crocinitomicaceae bacterium]|nr:phosphatidylinositol-specific phospholipase C domain-containing protein [Crocinitomicaceae bacterium]